MLAAPSTSHPVPRMIGADSSGVNASTVIRPTVIGVIAGGLIGLFVGYKSPRGPGFSTAAGALYGGVAGAALGVATFIANEAG
jgi:hypothetical protein